MAEHDVAPTHFADSFSDALELWGSWNRLGDRTPGEEAETPTVARLSQSVEAIMRELERYRD